VTVTVRRGVTPLSQRRTVPLEARALARGIFRASDR
jgi:hypothetical protein